jgi:hypothetical protein
VSAKAEIVRRVPGQGWLALVGGGEFSFGETLLADRAWGEKLAPGPVGFLPAASDSADYATHFADYLAEAFERECETIPIYRSRDARRGKNCGRIAACSAVYLGGGVTDHLLETLAGSPAKEALREKLRSGGVVVAIAAAAQCTGERTRSLLSAATLPGLGWLPGGVVETNFDPGHDRRLRKLLAGTPDWGLGIPAGSALLLGPAGVIETVGVSFVLQQAEADLLPIGQAPAG